MFQAKFMLFAVVALMAVSSAIAIMGGQDAARNQFPYFAHLKIHTKTVLNFPCTVILFIARNLI